MQRKPGFPSANCHIKFPDPMQSKELSSTEEHDNDSQQKRLLLINFAHSQWGFNNWSWSVTKQELDFVDFANGKFNAGVVAFVSVKVKSFNIHREDIGYATTVAAMKGSAIYQARRCAVTNALRETLFSFGGTVATDLQEYLELHKTETPKNSAQSLTDLQHENNQNTVNVPIKQLSIPAAEPKNACSRNLRTDVESPINNTNTRPPHVTMGQPLVMKTPLPVANASVPPIAKAHPIPANHVPPVINKPNFPANHMPPKLSAVPPQAVPPPMPPVRPNSNVSFVFQPVMSGMMPQMYGPPPNRMPMPPHIFPNAYYTEYAPWHFTYEGYDRHHGNVNLNFNIPPKNLVVHSRSGTVECKNACNSGRPLGPEGESSMQGNFGHPSNQGCWIKPTIFYDGFWTEQKVKKWVAEQVEKQSPEDGLVETCASPSNSCPPETPK